jgi:5-deoxy-5-amino-3-dehydroquinate synthase
MITVPVELGARRYDVLVGDGARHQLAEVVSSVVPGATRAAVVTQAGIDVTVDPGLPTVQFTVGDGEGAKSLGAVEELCRGFARSGLSRADVVIAVGGGVVTDLAGFAAAIFHRGTAYVNVATTLLAQVDAAIGGKTGVNLPEGKNLVGAFWQPRAVLCDTGVLSTLPPREWASGRGEMAKYAFLGAHASGAGGSEPDASLLDLPLSEQVARCAAVKAEMVASDEREGDRRMLLNYGHTLAHALEASAFEPAGGLDLRHGEAVAVGLVFAALLARRLGRVDDAKVELHRRVVGGFGLSPVLPGGLDPHQLLVFMARDKKAQQDLTFILDGPLGVEVVRGIGEDDVLATLADMVASGTAQSGTAQSGTVR